MAKIFMLTSRNVLDKSGKASGVGAATLIFRRATTLYNMFNCKTYILPLNGKVVDKHTGHIGCEFINNSNTSIKHAINYFIKENQPEVIIYSGEKSYLYDKIVRNTVDEEELDTSILIDLHGALEEGIEYKYGLAWFKAYIKYKIKTWMFKKIAQRVNGMLVVSDELRDHYTRLLSSEVATKLNVFKIRCGINEVISNDLKLRWRKEVRKIWGIDDDTTVFVYSGYRAAWQCIDEIIRYFKEIDMCKKKVFFVMLTKSDVDFNNMLSKIFPKGNYFVDLAPKDELFKYLCACDIGMLVRRKDFTNYVAFPNKFSDYVNAGLLLAISESLSEPVRLLNQYEIPYISLSPFEKFPTEFSIIDQRKNNMERFYEKCNDFCNNEILYSAQVESQYDKFSTLFRKNK